MANFRSSWPVVRTDGKEAGWASPLVRSGTAEDHLTVRWMFKTPWGPAQKSMFNPPTGVHTGPV